MNPFYLEDNTYSTVAICGKSGSGKTSTIRFIIAQMLLNNTQVIVCDPHGNAGTQSLADGIDPIKHLLAMPIAITLEDRITAFRLVHKILRDRIEGKDTNNQKICIILDEATSHFLECSKEQHDEFSRFLLSLTNEGRKKNISCYMLSQNWKNDLAGSRSIRSSITHVLFHRTSEDEVKLFVPAMPTNVRRTISTLPVGYMYVYPFMTKLSVPYISKDDLIDFASKFQNKISSVIIATPNPPHSHAESRHATIATHDAKKPESKLATAIKDIIRYKNNGMNKEDTIMKVLQIRKNGKSEKWKIASKFYDAVIERAYEQK